ncbi:protein kinase-like protein [Kineococcus xinjiangensis]|uniref:Protein kinase-like protein n=1 Tax=Kineococcus xinjiangensis TaxID=512762 RepID=A0A2S6IEI7_9ACTN|nr:protein kinase [Kineococcus xinjiangensis]PPK92621.1 protein kinase-like protein [Kineococcus xinjiangensis]
MSGDLLPGPGTAAPEAPPGFEVQGLLGSGGSAVVWLARHSATGEDVALKVWRRPLSGEYQRRRFRNECRWHRELSSHPNVVDWLWASSPDEAHPWIATRPHGVALDQHLRQHRERHEGRLPPLREGLVLALDLLDGLAAMHARGLVHRDVKPSNLLVRGGRGALCDLGIAMPVDEVTREHRAGTDGYLAPELLADGDPGQVPDPRTDVYAAAVTISRVLGDDAPHAIDHLVHARAASERRGDRPRDAGDFARRLRAAMTAAGMTAPSPPAAGSGTGPGGGDPGVAPGSVGGEPTGRARHRTAVVLGAALTAAVAAVAVTTWADRDDATPARGPDGAAPSAPSTTASQMPANPLVAAALAASPDIDPAGRPILRSVRDPGGCEGSPLSEGTRDHRAGERVVATTRVYVDERGRSCAMLEKAQGSDFHNVRSYLAISLCNDRGQCDHDWHEYRVNAGPVLVDAPDGCVTWRVSARDATGQQWLLSDEVHSVDCPPRG